MAVIGDSFKSIFLAGIGAMAYTGEKSMELVDALVEKGELTVNQGKVINDELTKKATEATRPAREAALEMRMAAMTPEERASFAAKAAEFAAMQNAKDAEKASANAAGTETADAQANDDKATEIPISDASDDAPKTE